MAKITLLIILLLTNIHGDSITVTYKLPVKTVQQALMLVSTNCNFVLNGTSNLVQMKMRYSACWTNIQLFKVDSLRSKVSFSSFCYSPATIYNKSKTKENANINRIVFQALDQELLKEESNYYGYHFTAKNPLLFHITNLVSPGVGWFYLTDSKEYFSATKWGIGTFFTVFDALSIWAIANQNVQLSYSEDHDSKPNSYGYYLGGAMLVLLRSIGIFGTKEIFEFQNNLQNSKYGFTFNVVL